MLLFFKFSIKFDFFIILPDKIVQGKQRNLEKYRK